LSLIDLGKVVNKSALLALPGRCERKLAGGVAVIKVGAGLRLTTEAMIAEHLEEKPAGTLGGMSGMGGMDGNPPPLVKVSRRAILPPHRCYVNLRVATGRARGKTGRGCLFLSNP